MVLSCPKDAPLPFPAWGSRLQGEGLRGAGGGALQGFGFPEASLVACVGGPSVSRWGLRVCPPQSSLSGLQRSSLAHGRAPLWLHPLLRPSCSRAVGPGGVATPLVCVQAGGWGLQRELAGAAARQAGSAGPEAGQLPGPQTADLSPEVKAGDPQVLTCTIPPNVCRRASWQVVRMSFSTWAAN